MVSLAGIRVRFDERGEPELNAEDLRGSNNEDLARLAEADRERSNALFSRGDDNGWLTLAEVEGAAGIHVSIQGGYQQLVEEAKQRRAPLIPSHIPPAKIRKFFLGLSNWYNVREFLKAPDEKDQWFEVDILARDREGRPTEMKVTPIEGRYFGDRTESWQHIGESWHSSEDPSAFVERYPILSDTLREIVSSTLHSSATRSRCG